ncbi:MAG: hypothetical protein ACLTQI_07385 [Slackia sp.]
MRPTDEIVSEPISSSGVAAALCPDIQAENALLVSEDGTVYFSRDASEPVKIASITKVDGHRRLRTRRLTPWSPWMKRRRWWASRLRACRAIPCIADPPFTR